jgi:phosphatidylglycerophosphatase C
METPVPAGQPLAVFDFDGTLTYADSLLPFFRETAGRLGAWAGFGLLSPVLGALALRLCGNQAAKERFVRWFLAGQTSMELSAAGARFATGRLRWLENPVALARVEWHRAHGHRLVLLSASLREYLDPWAYSHRFDDLVCTELEYREDCATGRLAGRNVLGIEKVRRVHETFPDWSNRETWAYGDSRSDQPLLKLARHAEFRPFRSAKWRSLSLAHTWRCLR